MRIEVDRDNLLRGIGIADTVISSKNINTILSNCLFNVSKDHLEIASTDNEIGIRTTVEAVSDSTLSFTVNGKKFAGILKELPKGTVIVEIDSSYLVSVISKGVKGQYKLVGTAKGDFPDIPQFDDEHSIEVDQALLKDAIRKVVYAAATDLIKPSFNGVYFVSEDFGTINAVATDSKRLSIVNIPVDKSVKLEEGVIIPLKTVHEVMRLLGNYGTCRFYLGKTQCFFRIGETELVSRVVDGQFPNYRQVIPHENKMNAVVPTRQLLESLKRVMIFTKEPSFKIVLAFTRETLKIEAKTQDLGEAEEEVVIEMDSEDSITVGMSAQYLIDAVKEIGDDEIILGLTSQLSPMVITPLKMKDSKSVIMPIQIKSEPAN